MSLKFSDFFTHQTGSVHFDGDVTYILNNFQNYLGKYPNFKDFSFDLCYNDLLKAYDIKISYQGKLQNILHKGDTVFFDHNSYEIFTKINKNIDFNSEGFSASYYFKDDGVLSMNIGTFEEDTDSKKRNNLILSFPNKEIARYFFRKNLLQRKLLKFSLENGGTFLDWSDATQPKYSIFYDYYDKKLFVGVSWTAATDCIYFVTEEIALKAIEKFQMELKQMYEYELLYTKYMYNVRSSNDWKPLDNSSNL